MHADCLEIVDRLLGRCDIEPDLPEDFGSDDEGEALARRLDALAERQLHAAHEQSSMENVRTALRHFDRFASAVRSVLLFVRVVNSDDHITAAAHNERTLRRFVAFLSLTVSRQTKAALQSSTIEGYVSLVRTAFSVRAGGRIDGDGMRIARQLSGLKRLGPDPVRRLRLPFRAQHFIKCGPAHFAGPAGTSIQRLHEWCALLFMHHGLARVGELGGAVLDPRTGLMRSHIIHFPNGADGCPEPFFVVMLRPLKSRRKQLHRVPVIIAQGDGGFADCYRFLRELEARDSVVGEAARAATPAFSPRLPAGGVRPHFSPTAVQSTLERVARGCGLDTSHFKCHSLRIGGATDTADQGGTEMECRLAGRWASDVFEIYARPTLAARILASKRLGLYGSVDLESLLAGRGVSFVQPA